ncbi:MAG: 2-phospho-L-lactate guanylyltransferase [Methanocalculaceae archaeon]|jgi:2-phospho-L-lactate guanylyltransferase|nr:2-phospho-L-lactate guanylyltransferase [Methanocalculaceae archaeon]
MYFHALIPYKPINPKTRLSSVMTQGEREEFAEVMLGDVISAVRKTGCEATLLCTTRYACIETRVAIRKEGLNEAINWALPQFRCPALIIMSDLPLITPESLRRILSTKADMAIVPGLGGGTNVIFVKHPETFHVEYYGFSFRRHLQIADELGLNVDIVDSMRMATDIDEPVDLVELMIHGRGNAREWLYEHGFSLSIENGRTSVTRNGEKLS